MTERYSSHYAEQWPVPSATLDDLDKVRLVQYFRSRFPGWKQPERWHTTLTDHKLAVEWNGRIVPTQIGVLLFSEKPSRFIPDAHIVATDHMPATPNNGSTKNRYFTGPLPEQVAMAAAWLRDPHPDQPLSERRDGGGPQQLYSQGALYEAVLNALAHRDYEIRQSSVRIHRHPDRILFENPGSLCGSLTPENLYVGCQPYRRNEMLTGYLHHYARHDTGFRTWADWQDGFLTLVRKSTELSGRRPLLEQIRQGTALTIYARAREADSDFQIGEAT